MSLFALNTAWFHYVLDGLVLIVIFIFSFISARRGFVACFFGFISTITALTVAFLLMKGIVRWTNGLFGLQGAIERGCTNVFSKFAGFTMDISSEGLEASLAGKLPNFLINAVVDSVGNSSVPEGTTIAMVVGETLANFVATVIAWVLLFFLTKLLMFLLSKILNSVIQRMPVVGRVNLILGMLVGTLQGFFIICGVVAIFALIPSQGIASFFNDCLILRVLYNQNPLHVVLGWIIS